MQEGRVRLEDEVKRHRCVASRSTDVVIDQQVQVRTFRTRQLPRIAIATNVTTAAEVIYIRKG